MRSTGSAIDEWIRWHTISTIHQRTGR